MQDHQYDRQLKTLVLEGYIIEIDEFLTKCLAVKVKVKTLLTTEPSFQKINPNTTQKNLTLKQNQHK